MYSANPPARATPPSQKATTRSRGLGAAPPISHPVAAAVIRPDTATAGNMSTCRRRRCSTVNTANPSADTRASKAPDEIPADPSGPFITAMPASTSTIASQVTRVMGSFNSAHPSSPARTGAMLKMNTTSATVVRLMAYTNAMEAMEMEAPAMTPSAPMSANERANPRPRRMATQAPITMTWAMAR